MTVLDDAHADHGATFGEVGGRRVPLHYGRPERTARAVRNGAGVAAMPYGAVAVRGDDRHGFVDDAVSNAVPPEEGRGCYALLLSPDGRVETDMYVYVGGDRLLCLVPPGRAGPLADDWSGKVFIEDVEVENVTDDVAVFGVHGPTATEAVAGVLAGAAAPDERLSLERGAIADAGVTVVRTDAPAGETGYEVVCDAGDAPDVLDALWHLGPGTVPFGWTTWETLTLEAGTPLFETELDGQVPNVAGVRNALDFEKGCYVGQEVVSRIENRGQPPERLVGLLPEASVERGADVLRGGDGDGDEEDGDAEADVVGTVTRAAESPALDRPVAMARVDYGLDVEAVTVETGDGGTARAEVAALPLVEGGERSARVPEYP